jgi:hypothetical protein
MTPLRLLLKLSKLHRDVKAVAKGRILQRVWNRGVTRVVNKVRGKLYR